MKSAPKLISFDAAGTLIHPVERVGETYARAARQEGMDLAPSVLEASFCEAFGRLSPMPAIKGRASADGDRAWWRTLVLEVYEESGWKDPAAERAFRWLFDHFAKPDAWALYPDVRPVLGALAESGYQLWLTSNFDPRLHPVVDGLGIGGFFAGRSISSELGASKPGPFIFESMLREARCAASECIHVGDDLARDGEGARSCGIAAWMVDRPQRDLHLLQKEIETGELSCLPSLPT